MAKTFLISELKQIYKNYAFFKLYRCLYCCFRIENYIFLTLSKTKTMNSKQFSLTISSLIIVLSSFTITTLFHNHETIALGTKAPMANEKMKAVVGDAVSLNDLKKENGLLVVFSCNTCPFVVGGMGDGWEGRYNEVNKIAGDNNIGMVLVNSNEAKRTKGDSFDNMVTRANEQKLESNYVIDTESKLANAFGARTTPHVFLFDKDMKLVYTGAIDDNVKNAKEVKEFYTKDALTSLGKGEKIKTNKTRNVGCSIKRVEH